MIKELSNRVFGVVCQLLLLVFLLVIAIPLWMWLATFGYTGLEEVSLSIEPRKYPVYTIWHNVLAGISKILARIMLPLLVLIGLGLVIFTKSDQIWSEL